MKPFGILLIFALWIILPVTGHTQETPTEEPVNGESTSLETEETEAVAESTEITPPEEPSSRRGVEKLQVTGSYIRRTDVEGPSPIVTIDRQQIEASGFDEVGQVLRGSTVSPFGGDGASVNLRGIGSTRSLILIDGHRAPKTGHSYDYVDGTNVNLVPLAAVERIEILKDGASATYGADALGGVVNIITRKDFDGMAFATKHNLIDPLGGDVNRTSIAYGWNTSKNTVLTSLQFQIDQESRFSAYPFRKAAPQSIAASPNYVAPNSAGTLTPGPNCVDITDGICRDNTSGDQKFLGGYTLGNATTWTHEFSSDTQSYVTFLGNVKLSGNELVGASYQTPGVGAGINFTGSEAAAATWGNQLGGGNYAAGDPIKIYGRLDQSRVTRQTVTTTGLITGLKGYFGDSDWSWDVNLNNQISLAHERRENQGLFAPTQAGIAAGTIDPFGTALDQGSLTADSINDNRYQVNWLNATTTGAWGNWIGASWSSAFGVSAAHFEYSDDSDDRVLNKSFMGLSGAEGSGERQLYSVFTELVAQWGSAFEMQLSERVDHYSDFGTPVSPKLAVRYQPTAGLMFRASAGLGFKAPELQEAYGAGLEGFFNGIIDQTKCNEDANFCSPDSFSGGQTSNQDLKEETSKNYNAGIVVEPVKNFNVGLDYWYVKVEGTIGGPPVQRLLNQEANGQNIDKYMTVERDATTNRITRILTKLSNLGTETADGVDLNLSYLLKTGAGDFKLSTEHSYLFAYRQNFFEGTPDEQILGQAGAPRWRNISTFEYSKSKWTGRVVARSAARVEQNQRDTGYVESFTQYDLSVDYNLFKDGTLQVGLLNAFDRQPRWDETRSTKIDSDLYYRFRTAFVSYRQTF